MGKNRKARAARRPPFIRHWSKLPQSPHRNYGDERELLSLGTPFAREFGLRRIGIWHEVLPPGRRTSSPHAERDEEEFVYVLEGAPDLWADGWLHRLKEGDAVGFPCGTGIGHTLINNTNEPVRLMVLGEAGKPVSKVVYFHDARGNARLRKDKKLWSDPPERRRGPHKGKPGSLAGRKRKPPPFVVNWRDIKVKDNAHYPKDDELMSVGVPLSRHLGLNRLGIWHETLKPGRRTSLPHAEADEEEFVFVLEGAPDAWIDGWLHPLKPGDGIGFPPGTGIAHTIMNNTGKPVRLFVCGEASRYSSRILYPLDEWRNRQLGAALWRDCPKRKHGPHDGLPDALRRRHKRKRNR